MTSICPKNVTNGSNELTSCCLEYATSTDTFYRAAQALHVITGIAGAVLSLLYIFKYSTKHLLPKNTKMFISITLPTIVIHSITLSAIHIYHLYQSFQVSPSDPCGVRNTVAFCAPFRYIFSFCVFLMVLNQYFMYVDRILGTFLVFHKSLQNYVLAILLSIEMPLTIILVMFIYQKVDSTETQLSCLNVPMSSMKAASIITAALLPLNCVCLVMSVLLFRTHQRKVQKTRFNVTRSFKATLNRDTMSFLRYTSATQAVIIVAYPVVILTVRMTSHHTPTILERTLATLAYVSDMVFSFCIFNWYCVLVPIVMIYAVRRHRMKRQKKIDNVMGQQVAGEEGSDYYFQLLQSQWDQEKEPKT